MQKIRFFGENLNVLHALLISFPSTVHVDGINSNITVLNNILFLILVRRTFRQGDILKPLRFSFYFISFVIWENDNISVLKALNIGQVISYNTVRFNL